MNSFGWKKKKIEDSIKDGMTITAKTMGIFFALKAANVKPPKASLDVMDIMKLDGGICGGVLVKAYAVHKKWINQWCNKNFMPPSPKGNKITQHQIHIARLILLILGARPTQSGALGWFKGTSGAHFTLIQVLETAYSGTSTQIKLYFLRTLHPPKPTSNFPKNFPFWLRCFTFQWLKSQWNWWHSGGPLHLQDKYVACKITITGLRYFFNLK